MGSALDRAVLEIDADVDGDGADETGVFHLVGNLEITQVVTPKPIIGPSLSNITSAVRRIINNGDANRKGAYVDVGAGRHAFDMNFIGWEGAIDSSGNELQWGNTGDSSTLTVGDATGEDPLTQMQVLNRYLQVAVIDSFNPARLYVGEYDDGTYGSSGVYAQYAPLKVVLEANRSVRTSDSLETFDGSITAVEVLNLEGMVDVTRRLPV